VAAEETLPKSERREPKYFLRDCVTYLWQSACNVATHLLGLLKVPLRLRGYDRIDDDRCRTGPTPIVEISPEEEHFTSGNIEVVPVPNEEGAFLEEDDIEILSYIEFPDISASLFSPQTGKQFFTELRASSISAGSSAVHQNKETMELLPSQRRIANAEARSFSSHSKDEEELATIRAIWANKPCRQHLLVFWMYGFVTVGVDGAFPLYCMSVDGGLAINEAHVGAIQSLAGTIINFCQYHVYIFFLNRFGLRQSMMFNSFVSVLLLAFIPLSLPLNEGAATGKLTPSAFSFLTAVLATARVFGSSVFAALLVSMHRTVVPSHRSTMNGLCALFASVGRAFGPLFAGALVGHCYSHFPPRVGSVVVFAVLALCGLASSVVLVFLIKDSDVIEREGIKKGEDVHT